MTSRRRPEGAFYVDAGWYASRGQDGSVTLAGPDGEEVTWAARTWVTVVASLSAAGLNPETRRAALLLHQGEAEDT